MKRKRLVNRLLITIVLCLIALASVTPYLMSETRADFAAEKVADAERWDGVTNPSYCVSNSSLLYDYRDWPPIVPPEPREVDGAEDSDGVEIYDVATGEVTRLPSRQSVKTGLTSTPSYEGLLSLGMDPESVFPPDERTKISPTTGFPWRTICKLYITFPDGACGGCSGAIIGCPSGHGYVVLTAGHCIYNHDHGGWATSVEVIPGFDNGYMPYYHAWMTTMWTYTKWVNDADHQYDLGCAKLDRNIGDYTGWMDRKTADPSDPVYTGILNTAGYPGDLSGGLCMYHDADYGRTATTLKHYYWMDTYKGQSGSPVWVYYSATNERYILTVHGYGGTGPPGGTGNSGARLTQGRLDDIDYYCGLWSPPTDYADLIDDGQAYSGFTPTTVAPGESFQVWCDVRNIGTESSGGFYVSYYASTNTYISEYDYLIGTDYVSSINPFTPRDSSWSGNFLCGIPAGTYYIGWIIDSGQHVTEFDEGNNVAYKDSYQLTVEPCDVTFYTNPSNIGSITFEGQTYTNGQSDSFDCGTSGPATANAPSCWTLDHWETTGNIQVSSTIANPTTVTINCGGTLKAVFKRIECRVIFYTDPSTIGSITFEGQTYTNGQSDGFNCGTSGPATANAPTCWKFLYWVATGNVQISSATANPTTVSIKCGGTLKAVFGPIKCNVTFYTYPTIGSITFEGQTYTNGQSDGFNCGTSGPATANAPTCWRFDHWETTGNVKVSSTTANPTTVTITCGGTLKAVFKRIECKVIFYTNPSNIGSITFGKKNYTNGETDVFPCGTEDLATANAPECWMFDHWETKENVYVKDPKDNPTLVAIRCGGSLTAVFRRIECKIVFYTSPSKIGSINFEGKNYTNGETDVFPCGTEDLATANAPECWMFDHWETKENVYVKDPKANPTFVSIRCGGALVAVFKQIECKVTFYTSPSDIGAIIFREKTYTNGESDTFLCGTEDWATAKAPKCWEFDHWETKDNVTVRDPKANPTFVSIRCGGALVAVFKQIECNVTFYTDPSDIGSITIGLNGMTYINSETGTFLCGTKESAYADAPSCWTFAYWETTGNVYVSNRTANPTNVTITCGGTLKAVFYAVPDLVVTDVQLPYPIPILYEGIKYDIGVTVENVGPSSADSFNVSLQLYWVQGGLIDYYGEVSVPGLASGENVTVYFQANTAHITVTILTATADCNDDVTECDELNNRLEISMRSRIAGDIDGNDKVDHVDLLLLAGAYGSKAGDENYNPLADLNADGKVDHVDLLILAGNYGKELPE